MLLHGSPKRFSIDADIVISKRANFDKFFTDFLSKKGFTRFELQERDSAGGIEKYHYKFFYKPVFKSRLTEDNVLLDILVETPVYNSVTPVDITSPFVIQQGAPVPVNIPSVEDILGDKLTAFAPNTTGVPYEKGGFSMSMEIIKQLYDIGTLFDSISSIKTVASTFENIAKIEMKYRGISGSVDIILDDIIETALCLSSRGRAGKGDFRAMQNGISRMKAYIFSESYQIEKAIVHAARAAYCAALIRAGSDEISRFRGPEGVADLTIDGPRFAGINRLKRSNPEAFFYWYQLFAGRGDRNETRQAGVDL